MCVLVFKGGTRERPADQAAVGASGAVYERNGEERLAHSGAQEAS